MKTSECKHLKQLRNVNTYIHMKKTLYALATKNHSNLCITWTHDLLS